MMLEDVGWCWKMLEDIGFNLLGLNLLKTSLICFT